MVPDSTAPKRVLPLDGLRGVAILIVLIWHYVPCLIRPQSPPLLHLVGHLFRMTWIGVEIFFALSGFLICGILLDHRNAGKLLGVFYVRRFFRIFPVYYLILVVYVCLLHTRVVSDIPVLFTDVIPPWACFLFVQNIFMGIHSTYGGTWLSATWSLALEEQFYLLFPLAVVLLPRRRLVIVMIAFTLSAPILRSLWPNFHASVELPWRCDALLPGAMLAVLVRQPGFWPLVRRNRSVVIAAVCSLFVGVVAMAPNPIAFGPLLASWLAAFSTACLLWALIDQDAQLGTILSHPALTWLGTRSYGIYLYHEIVAGLAYGLILHRDPRLVTASDGAMICMCAVLTLAVAELSFRYFEMPLLRIGHRFKYGAATHNHPPVDTALPAM